MSGAPCVGSYQEVHVDPAQWFKVLVIGSILVDCDHRTVYWTIDKTSLQTDLTCTALLNFFRKQEILFGGISSQELDPNLDELFQKAAKLFIDISKDISADETAERFMKFSEELLKTLYVLILPEIKFKRQHHQNVKDVKLKIEEELTQVEIHIQEHLTLKKVNEESLKKQRQVFLNGKGLEYILNVAETDMSFIQKLLKHIEKDIRKFDNMLFFESLDNSTLDPTVPDMEIVNIEAEKLSIMDELQILQAARLKIIGAVNILARRSRPKRFSLLWHHTPTSRISSVFSRSQKAKSCSIVEVTGTSTMTGSTVTHDDMAVRKQQVEVTGTSTSTGSIVTHDDMAVRKQQVEVTGTSTSTGSTVTHDDMAVRKQQGNKESVFKKLESVKPNSIQQQILQYKAESEALEDMFRVLNQYISTKVRLASIREATWLTCDDIEQKGSSFGYHNRKGTRYQSGDVLSIVDTPRAWLTLKDQVKVIIESNRSRLKTKHDKFCTNIRENCRKLQQESNNGCSATNHEAHTDNPKLNGNQTCQLPGNWKEDKCKAICEQIVEHHEQMAYVLQQELKGSTDMKDGKLYKNVYICYEEYLSEEVMPSLTEVYEQSFHTRCKNLAKWIKQHAKIEIESIVLTMNKLVPTSLKYERANLTEGKTDCLSEDTENLHESVECVTREKTCITTVKEADYRKSMIIKSTFANFFVMIQEENMILSVTGKLQQLTKATRYAADTVSDICRQGEKMFAMSADDLLDTLVLLLYEMDEEDFIRLFAHVTMVSHLVPKFLYGGIYDNTLVNITVAYQHLSTRQNVYDQFNSSC